MAKVGIVVDSTCDISQSELRELDVHVVPLKVLFGEESFLDGVEITPEEFYRKLATVEELPKTSQPSPMQFLEAYNACAAEGCSEVVCLTLSAELSGTFQSAHLAAQDSPIPVHTVDTKKVSLGFGLIVREVVARRAEGDYSGEELAAFAQGIVDTSEMYFILDTMKYIVMGGRAGKAAGLAAALLNIKPILEVGSDGVVAPVKKAKGRHKAISELAKLTKSRSDKLGPLKYGVIYSNNISVAHEMSNALDTVGINGRKMGYGAVGPVIGTYAGFEATGVVLYPDPDK